MESGLKPVRWIGTSLSNLRSFPRAVRIDIGHALFTAQEGKIDPAAKPLKGFGGASVLEIVAAHHGNSRLHLRFQNGRLCFARISEEIYKGYRYTDKRD